MEVNRFKAENIDIVYEVQREAYKPLYEKYHDEMNPYTESKDIIFMKYTRKNTQGYLFTQDGKVVGCVRINLYPESKSARILALAVLPEYQGQGIAQKALLKIEKIHNDIEIWLLDTILQEPGSCYLYEKLGYRKTGQIEKIKETMTLVYYEKRIVL